MFVVSFGEESSAPQGNNGAKVQHFYKYPLRFFEKRNKLGSMRNFQQHGFV